jgi:hypothetical protein
LLAGALFVGLLGWEAPARGDEPRAPEDGDGPEVEALVRKARTAGLKAVGVDRTDHYVAVGDAPPAFRKKALELCERLALGFEKHFKAKEFKVALPKSRMPVVILAGRDSYAAFKGEKVEQEEGGHYDVEADRLVIFDAQGDPVADASRVNTFTLVHEGLHQLTFAAGLLARKGDVPRAVSEGLATYGETWRLSDQVLGRPNRLRFEVLTKPGADWISVEQLLTRDEVFEATAQVAYAESWLLVYHLLDRRPAKMRAYLDLLRNRREPAHRAEDATEALGKLSTLDRELRTRARRLSEQLG